MKTFFYLSIAALAVCSYCLADEDSNESQEEVATNEPPALTEKEAKAISSFRLWRSKARLVLTSIRVHNNALSTAVCSSL